MTDQGFWVEPIYYRQGFAHALPTVVMRLEIAALLGQAAIELSKSGYGLLIWDAWRPLELQRELYNKYRDDLRQASGLEGAQLDAVLAKFVTSPERVTPPPPHLTGAAIDLTLCDPATGVPIEMGGAFDELTPRSHPNYYDGDAGSESTTFASRRALLAEAMHACGFVPFSTEWWHFEFGTALWAAARERDVMFGPIGSC